ncbi:hypothetical protein KY362_02660 [Candidatus Woesearchaeota archaeon]|nr:hypothetical protein [Candidatus Woesearchaeota archaeon]
MGYLYACSGWESVGWMLLKAVVFTLACFVFSLVFWLTKHAMDKAVSAEKTKKKKK